MAVPSNYAALVTAIDAILTTYGLSLFQVFGGRSTQPSLRELISLRWKLFSMTTPANYATLIAEIDVVIESYGLSLQEVFGGRSTQPTLQELIDLRYELFEVDGGASDPSQITSTSKPTTRADGSALQQGDRWYNPNTGIEGFRDSSLWLSTPILVSADSLINIGGTFSAGNGSTATSAPRTFYSNIVYFEEIKWHGGVAAGHNSSNYFILRSRTFQMGGIYGYGAPLLTTQDVPASSTFSKSLANQIFDLGALGAANIGFDIYSIGNPASSTGLNSTNISYSWRYVL